MTSFNEEHTVDVFPNALSTADNIIHNKYMYNIYSKSSFISGFQLKQVTCNNTTQVSYTTPTVLPP